MKTFKTCNTCFNEDGTGKTWTSTDLIDELMEDYLNGNHKDVASLFKTITVSQVKQGILLQLLARVNESGQMTIEVQGLLRGLIRAVVQ